MRKYRFYSNFLSSTMIVSALSLTACTDKDYDFDNVDSTVGVGGNELNPSLTLKSCFSFCINQLAF